MHRALPKRWLQKTLRTGDVLPASGVPLFLCPTIQHGGSTLSKLRATQPVRLVQRRTVHVEATSAPIPEDSPATAKSDHRDLPLTCSGCGAFAQTNDSNQLGYYDVTAKRVRNWRRLQDKDAEKKSSEEDDVINEVLKSMDSAKLEELGLSAGSLITEDRSDLLQAGEITARHLLMFANLYLYLKKQNHPFAIAVTA